MEGVSLRLAMLDHPSSILKPSPTLPHAHTPTPNGYRHTRKNGWMLYQLMHAARLLPLALFDTHFAQLPLVAFQAKAQVYQQRLLCVLVLIASRRKPTVLLLSLTL